MYVNPRKTALVRHLGKVDIQDLRAAVLAIPDEQWEAENAAKPNKFTALDVTRHIVFRFVADFKNWRHSENYSIWDVWRGRLEGVLAQATAPYGYARGGFPRIMLARMPAGGVIHPHRDANPSAKWPHKIHVPLLTNDKTVFYIEGVAHHFAEGEAVEVNNMGVHAVTNAGDTDRIHLIFEYYDLDQPDPDWIAGAQERAGA